MLNFQTLLFPVDIIADMGSADKMHQRQNSKSSLRATIQAAIYLAYTSAPDVVIRVAIKITNIRTIKNVNIIDVPPLDIEPGVIHPQLAHNTRPPPILGVDVLTCQTNT